MVIGAESLFQSAVSYREGLCVPAHASAAVWSVCADGRYPCHIWVVLYFIVFGVASFALALTLRGQRRYVFLSLAFFLLVTSYPLTILIQLGQIDLLVASLTVLSLVCYMVNRQIMSAVLLSIATLFKGTAVFLLIYFVLFHRNSKYLVYFVVSTLAIVGISLTVVPIRFYFDYLVNVLPHEYASYDTHKETESVVRLLQV